MIPQPKYQVGQTVWTATATDVAIHATCPDCNGSQKWEAKSPAGETFEFPCPRCTGHDVHKMRHMKATYAKQKLTIGSVRVNSEDACPVSYMCHETGVGSGTVWRETMLSADEAGADDIGRVAVAEREIWRAKQIAQHERNNGAAGTKHRVEVALRYHTFTTAEIIRERANAWQVGYRFENLCNAIAELDDYGGIEGLDGATLDRIVSALGDDHPMIKDCRDAVMADREKARKAA